MIKSILNINGAMPISKAKQAKAKGKGLSNPVDCWACEYLGQQCPASCY